MKTSILKVFTCLLCLFSLSLHADVRDNATGLTFPSEVTFEKDGKQYRLQATGVATRKKFFVKVYSVASYLQEGGEGVSSDKFQQIMQNNKAKQLTMKWVHEAGAEKVQEGYRESFRKALSAQEYNQLQKEIETYVQFFNQNVQKGDEHIIRWIPQGEVDVIVNGNKVGSLSNQEFARGLWTIWFGQNSVVDRDNLVSLMK